MKPKEIEDQIKGLLGLNLGGAPPGSLPLSVGSPGSSHHQRPRNPISGAPSRGTHRPRHSPAPFGNIGGHRPPVPFQQPRNTVPTPVNKNQSISTSGIKEPSVSPSDAPIRAPGAYPHKPSKLKMGLSEDDGDKKNRKPKVRNRKRNDGNISKDDIPADADGGRESSITEIKEIYALEASKENATENQDDYKPSDAVLEYLAGKYLYPLTHKSTKFPRAKWFCRLCEYHCDNLTKCKEHFLDTRHSRLSRTKEIETTLYHLPRPNKHHLDCLNNLLASIEKEHGLSSSDLNTRQAVAQSVHSLLQNHIPGCFVRLYGSSLSGFGLKSANINLDLQITADHKPHLALLKALEVLQESADFLDVVDEFTIKIPTIKFQTSSGLSCELSLNNHHAYQTSSILKDYMTLDARVRTVGVAFRYWANLVRLDRQAEGTLPPHTFAILLIYFLQQQTKPVVPCIHEFLDASGEDVYVTPVNALSEWRTQNKESPAELWIELFAFLSIGFKSTELVVSIRKSGMLTNEEKQWKTKRLSVEDPFSSKRNLCRSIQAGSVYDYIADCLKTGYLYFGTIQTSLGSIITRIKVKQGLEDSVEDVSLSDWTLESWLAKKGTVLTEQEAVAATALVPRNMLNFSFNQTLLTNGTVPAVQCLVCGAEGHLPSSCPEEQLPPLTKLPHLSHLYIKLLDSVCDNVARDWEPQEPELRDRDYIMNDLNRFIKKFWPESELTLFGSSSNGFAFRHSDLDISLTFNGVATSADLDCIALIEELSERIKRMVGMRNVVAITSAKVPIVKLFHYQCQIEADISLYNVLARENTRLLSLYADLDTRCRTLGYMVKLFAKICDIGDASRGSLSSYAYILMMIFYLQKVSPPVLPVLQEMYPTDSEKPENIVDGWNAWFFSDRRKVVNEWAGYNRNKMSVGELWIGFLHFYAGEWDDKRLVVSIRQSRPLTKFEKMWNSPCIAIEDPFELSHNLGAGISRKMNLYIKKAFINGRKLFGTPFKYDPPGYRTIQDYFFDPELLTDGAPPNDRGCRACGKIGHLVADCPRKRAADQRKKQAKDRQRSLTEQHEGGKSGDGAGVRNRTKSEIPKAGNDDKMGVVGVSTDIRLKDKIGVKKEASVPVKESTDREKIKNLEKKRKRNGKLSKEENKILYDLYKKKSKKSATGVKDSDTSNEVQSDTCNDSFEKAMVNVGFNVSHVEVRKPLPSYKDDFDYNSIKPIVVAPGQIDYLQFDFPDSCTVNQAVSKRLSQSGFIDYDQCNVIGSKTADLNIKSTGFIDYYQPLRVDKLKSTDVYSKSTQSSYDSTSEYSASNESSTVDEKVVDFNSAPAYSEKNVDDEDVAESNDNEMMPLRTKLSDLKSIKSKKFEKIKLRNETRKLKKQEKVKAKMEKRLKKIDSQSIVVDFDLLKIAENYIQMDLCYDAEKKYFSF